MWLQQWARLAYAPHYCSKLASRLPVCHLQPGRSWHTPRNHLRGFLGSSFSPRTAFPFGASPIPESPARFLTKHDCKFIEQTEMEALAERSGFTMADMMALQGKFETLSCGKDHLTISDFSSSLELLGVIDAALCQRYFNAFDKNKNGQIEFQEFILGVAALHSSMSVDLRTPPHILRDGRDVRLVWDQAPKRVLIVKKWRNKHVTKKMKQVGAWLQQKGIEVYAEEDVAAEECPEFLPYTREKSGRNLDFMICIGGDGTMIYLNSLFDEDHVLPPCICFSMGSLGFLTPFDVDNYESILETILRAHEEPIFCTLRTRLRCEVIRPGVKEEKIVHYVLNECLIDRGGSPSLTNLALSVDGTDITTVQADGIIIATASGSTAYNMSAGGPMVAPSVRCMAITPIAPHSLSFRPVVIPETSIVDIQVPKSARGASRISFDGKNDVFLHKGDRVQVVTAICPFPVINVLRYDMDWFGSLVDKLGWNKRIIQGEFSDSDDSE